MKLYQRYLALPALALGLLAAAPAFALTADEEAVAKRVEAFRTAQMIQDAKTLEELPPRNSATATRMRAWRTRRPSSRTRPAEK